MELGLTGKAALVTGGASNIGRAIVLSLAAEGAHVVIADIDEAQAERVSGVVSAGSWGGRVLVVPTDVTDPEQVEAVVGRTVEEFGQIDVLVNNVGWTFDRLFLDKPREELVREVDINLWGVIDGMRAALAHMVEQGSGRIVSVSSDAGRAGEYREAVYSACKAGVIGLTKSLAREVGRVGIAINCVCPGLTVPEDDREIGEASMWHELKDVFTVQAMEKAKEGYPLRRLGRAQDTANAVVFLCSDAASFITGQTLSVSGGYTMV